MFRVITIQLLTMTRWWFWPCKYVVQNDANDVTLTQMSLFARYVTIWKASVNLVLICSNLRFLWWSRGGEMRFWREMMLADSCVAKGFVFPQPNWLLSSLLLHRQTDTAQIQMKTASNWLLGGISYFWTQLILPQAREAGRSLLGDKCFPSMSLVLKVKY